MTKGLTGIRKEEGCKISEFGEILVTPEYLKQRAQGIREQLERAVLGYREIEETINKTEGCFQGKSGDKMRKRINSEMEKCVDQIEILRAFPDKLDQIAEEYSKAEGDNRNVAMGH